MFVKTLLFDPGTFFEENPWADDLAAATGVVVLTALVTVVNLLLMGLIFAQKIDATVTHNGQQVSADSVLWDVFLGQLPVVFIAAIVGWVLVTAVLHIGIKLADGEGTFGDSLRITGWATIPTIFTAFLVTGSVYLTLRGQPISSSPEQFVGLVQRMQGGAGILGVLISLVSVGWQGYIWAFGMKEFHELEPDTALLIAGIVAFLLFITSVV
ncbi:Yip1 family protein [Haladaptatus sp. DYSN1]|uniref:Yip1 family protein n=1 Tax=unclassified Haladaptatus TaxID=2622732 RepID=UPI002404E0F0|nr:Yip1 family protein [Haladaptatus sp. DYSN1]